MNIFEGIDQNLVNAFLDYHAKHPDVYDSFKHFAGEMLDRGFKKISARQLIERIRWYYNIERPQETDIRTAREKNKSFKINNDFSALFARLLESKEPRFIGAFEKREMKSKNRCWSDRQRKMEGKDL